MYSRHLEQQLRLEDLRTIKERNQLDQYRKNNNLNSLRFVQASSCTRRPKLTDPAQGPALTTTPTDISTAIPSSRDYQRQHNASPATAAARNNDDDDDDEQ